MDHLATELQGLRGAGHVNPFVYVDLKKHVPRWATNEPREAQGDDEQPLSKEIANAVARSINPGANADKKVPLSWNQWLLAFPRYAIEAAVCGMVPYTASMGHMVSRAISLIASGFHLCLQAVCQRIAETASSENGRQRWLAIIYDEVGL